MQSPLRSILTGNSVRDQGRKGKREVTVSDLSEGAAAEGRPGVASPGQCPADPQRGGPTKSCVRSCTETRGHAWPVQGEPLYNAHPQEVFSAETSNI